jgi:hypothetical protein
MSSKFYNIFEVLSQKIHLKRKCTCENVFILQPSPLYKYITLFQCAKSLTMDGARVCAESRFPSPEKQLSQITSCYLCAQPARRHTFGRTIKQMAFFICT